MPGPGYYEGDAQTVRRKSPSYTMSGKASRMQSPALNQTPGPGQYKTTGIKSTEGPKFVFGSSQRGNQKLPDTPGPG